MIQERTTEEKHAYIQGMRVGISLTAAHGVEKACDLADDICLTLNNGQLSLNLRECSCPKSMLYHAINCPASPGEKRGHDE